jgi:Phage capsid family
VAYWKVGLRQRVARDRCLAAAVSHKSLSVSTKATTDSSSIAPSLISDYRLPPVTALREPTRVLSLLPTFATQHPTVTWCSTTGTTAAAAVAEGGTKPTSTIAYTPNTGTVIKLAHVLEVTDETLQDFLSFLGLLQQDTANGLYKAENAELLNATVTGAHKFAGLLNASNPTIKRLRPVLIPGQGAVSCRRRHASHSCSLAGGEPGALVEHQTVAVEHDGSTWPVGEASGYRYLAQRTSRALGHQRAAARR